MLLFLVFVIVLILLFGGSAVLGAALGIFGWILGIVAVIGFSVWFATTFDVDVGIVIVSLVFGPLAGLFAVAFVGFHMENRKLPRDKQRTFSEFWEEVGGK